MIRRRGFLKGLAAAFPLNCCIFCDRCFPLEFPGRKHVPEVAGDHRLVPVEELRDLIGGQPDRVVLEPHLQRRPTIGRLV